MIVKLNVIAVAVYLVSVVIATSDLDNPELPPLIFPTDKSKNNIVPINKTAIKVLLHSADQDATNNSKNMALGEIDDLKKTDQDIADLNAENKGSSTFKAPKKRIANFHYPEEDAENIQEIEVETNGIELEERYHRPISEYYIRREKMVLIDSSNDGILHNQYALMAVGLVICSSLLIYATLVWWRNKMQHRRGHRHRLVAEDNFNELTL